MSEIPNKKDHLESDTPSENGESLAVPGNGTSHVEDNPNRPDPIIKVDHVQMVFNMASEQLQSLKEYFIKIAKHELRFKEFIALDDISFEIHPGEVYGLIGTNGSGKSTLLKIIAGVLEPTKGTCETHGVIAPLIELGAGFDMELTARENIYLNGALLGYSKEYLNEHFDEIVDFAEIRSFLDMPLKNYSSGMVARIAFSIATSINPDILIVDETLSVGDQFFQEKCEKRIHELIDEHHVTVLFVSHSIDQVMRICNKVIWIEQGQMRMIGPAEEVCNAYGYRMEGLQAVLVDKGSNPSLPEDPEENPVDHDALFDYSIHVSNHSWQRYSEGEAGGSFDYAAPERFESLIIWPSKELPKDAIVTNAFVEGIGWIHDPDLSSKDTWTTGDNLVSSEDNIHSGRRVEELQIALTGTTAERYDIYYRVFSRGYGWMDWKSNGEIAGAAPFVTTLQRERSKSKKSD